jgi:hypothetical protein
MNRRQATTASREPVTDWPAIQAQLSPRNREGLEAWRARLRDLSASVVEGLEGGGEIKPVTLHAARQLAAAIGAPTVAECQPLAGGLGRVT